MRAFTFSALLCLLHSIAIAQSGPVYAVWEDPLTQNYFFVEIDAVSGTKNNISIISGMSAFVAGNKTAFNSDSNYYYVTGLFSLTPHLFTIDVSTGNTINIIPILDNVVGLEYNCNDSMLYGLREFGNNYDLVKVDPVTGVITPYGGVSSINGYVGDSFTLDKLQNQYNFVALTGTGYVLLSFDVTTGMNVASNPFPGSTTGYRYSCTDSSVFALRENNNQYLFLNVDVNNGIATTVAPLAGVTPGFIAENATVNSNGEYIYRGFDANNNFALITIDINTGNVINTVQTNDNATGFETGICCLDTTGSGTTGVSEANINNITVFPNPATEKLNINFSTPVEQIHVYSIDGKRILTKRSDLAKKINFDVSMLSQGLYSFVFFFKDGSILTRRIIKK